MKVGLTGQRGFIGSNLVSFLQGHNHEVLTYPYDVLSYMHHELDDTIKNSDVTIHLAGKNKDIDRDMVHVNVYGTLNMIEKCKKYHKPLVLAGTTYEKEDPYKWSKDAAKSLCRAYQHEGLSSMVLNIPKVFGPGCKPNYNSFVSTLIYYSTKDDFGWWVSRIKDMKEKVTLIYIDDLCESIECLLKDKFYQYNEYNFTKYDGVFDITFEDITKILSGMKDHPHSEIFLKTKEWYKTYDISKT